jgi:hypothetical protein
MTLDLTPDERAVLRAELAQITREPRFPFSPRTGTLPGILARREPRSRRCHLYEPSRHTAARRRARQ